MRLPEVERGESLPSRLLISFISRAMRMRLPDAARVAFYDRDFGKPLGDWTQAAMRGTSSWTVGERELMAAMVATWTSCAFCKGAHSAIAAKELPTALVDAALSNFETAPLPTGLKATLTFLQKMTVRPQDLAADDVRSVVSAGVTQEALIDAIAVATLFNVVTRYADALGFAIPTRTEFERSADMLLKRGYG
jgi:uncharacterized peroxidase-related enzyme